MHKSNDHNQSCSTSRLFFSGVYLLIPVDTAPGSVIGRQIQAVMRPSASAACVGCVCVKVSEGKQMTVRNGRHIAVSWAHWCCGHGGCGPDANRFLHIPTIKCQWA